MTIEKTIQGIRITDIVNGDYISKHYIGYTKKEAVKLFRELKNGGHYNVKKTS